LTPFACLPTGSPIRCGSVHTDQHRTGHRRAMEGRMRRLICKYAFFLSLLPGLWFSGVAVAESARQFDRDIGRYAEVMVTGPYLDLHTGPGRRYPVFNAVPRGEHVQILLRRTDWFKVRDERDREGWVRREDIEQTQMADGEPLPLEDPDHRDTDALPWIAGAASGRLGHSWNNSVFVGYSPTPRLTFQLEGSHQPTRSYDRLMVLAGIHHIPKPEWRITPFFEAGAGITRVHANIGYSGTPTLGKRSVGYYGAGLRWELNNRFEFRLQERAYLLSKVSHPNQPNEALNEWKAGFAFYF